VVVAVVRIVLIITMVVAVIVLSDRNAGKQNCGECR
jgi:hypothetical protein